MSTGKKKEKKDDWIRLTNRLIDRHKQVLQERFQHGQKGKKMTIRWDLPLVCYQPTD